ncbi:MAG: hypothetical protein U9R38_01400 [Candidatus Margulisiibacteriota bacterium]|nr:hypothetical protein [Candidatus Margulisiibacteriota bacterium]
MNPVKKFNIGNYKEVLKEIEELGKFDCLKELEDRVIQEISALVQEGTDEAKRKLEILEQLINEELDFKPRSGLLISALKNSITGAISAAKFSLF